MIYFIGGMLVMMGVTYLPRVIPLILIKKPIKSKWLQSFLYYIPYAVLAAMTFPAVFWSTKDVLTGVFGALVSVILSYFGGSLLKVSIVTVCLVYLIGVIR